MALGIPRKILGTQDNQALSPLLGVGCTEFGSEMLKTSKEVAAQGFENSFATLIVVS